MMARREKVDVMLGILRDAWADAVGAVLTWTAELVPLAIAYPAHVIGGVVVAIGFIVAYNHREDLA